MKTSGFWPDFRDKGSYDTYQDKDFNLNSSKIIDGDSTVVTFKIELKTQSATILCVHLNENILLFNMKEIVLVINSSKLTNVTTLNA